MKFGMLRKMFKKWPQIEEDSLRLCENHTVFYYHWRYCFPVQCSSSPRVVKGLKYCHLRYFFKLILDKERDGEEHRPAVPPIHVPTGWFLHVPSLGTEPTTVAHWDGTLINRATWPGCYLHLNVQPSMAYNFHLTLKAIYIYTCSSWLLISIQQFKS